MTEGLLCNQNIIGSWFRLPSSYEESIVEKDIERTAFLEGYGVKVIRIPNNEISRNFHGVCEYIDVVVRQSLSQPIG